MTSEVVLPSKSIPVYELMESKFSDHGVAAALAAVRPIEKSGSANAMARNLRNMLTFQGKTFRTKRISNTTISLI